MASVDLRALSGERGEDRPTAWVFSGGGIDGAFHAGVVARAVERLVWRPNDIRLHGTSTGAYTAVLCSMWSEEPNLPRRLRELWPTIAGERLWLQSVQARLIDRMVPRGLRLEELPIPVTVTATEVETSERTILDRGPVRDVLLAASAWPGAHPPVEVDGHRYQDGGLAAYCDLLAPLEAGCSQAFAVDCCNRAPGAPRPSRSRRHALSLGSRINQFERHQDAASKLQIRRDLLICEGRMPTLLLMSQLSARGARIPQGERIAADLELGGATADYALRPPYLDRSGSIARTAVVDTVPQLARPGPAAPDLGR